MVSAIQRPETKRAPGAKLGRPGAAASAGKLGEAVGRNNNPRSLGAASAHLEAAQPRGPEIAVITNARELREFLLNFAAETGLKNTQRQFIFQPERSGKGPIADVCEFLSIVRGDQKLIDIDTRKPVPAKFPISAFVSDLFKVAGVKVPPRTRLMRLDVDSIGILGGKKVSVGLKKSKGQDEDKIAKSLDAAGYSLTQGKRAREGANPTSLSHNAITKLTKARVKLLATMVRDLRAVSEEVGQLGGEEAIKRAEHLRAYAQEVLDLYFPGQKLDQVGKVSALMANADQARIRGEIERAQGLSADKCEVTSIKELMLGDDKAGRALAAKEFVYHLSNYYQMFPKGEVEDVKTYLKYMLHPEFASMNWNIITLSARGAGGDTRAVAGIHFQAPDPHIILSELEATNPGLLQKRLGVKPEDLRSFLDSLKPEEKALISSAWVEHFYRNPSEDPKVGQQLIKTALGVAKKYGNGVVSFEHEDINLTSWQLDVYSAGMVGLHPIERALAYAFGGARIMVDPLTNKPLLNVQPELSKDGEQNYELAWGFIFKEGQIPETLSIKAVKTFLLARYGTIDAIDPRSDGTASTPSAFAQMFNRLSELERRGISEIKFVASRDVFFKDSKAA